MLPQKERVQIVGAFPPPVMGQAVVTQSIANELNQRGQTSRFDWLPNIKSRVSNRFVKAIISVVAPAAVVYHRIRGYRTVYTVANHGWGMFYNLFVVATARLVGCRSVVHHHAHQLLEPKDVYLFLPQLVDAAQDCHVVLGEEMATMLRTNYQVNASVRVLTNSFYSLRSGAFNTDPQPHKGEVAKLRLGHLSNLCVSKGIDVVVDTFRCIKKDYDNVKLVLAGPAATKAAAAVLREAEREFGADIEYHGPVYGDDKKNFFRDIDVMLYPTRNDAQPLVIIEALSFGVPTISTSVGCIPSLLRTPEWITPDVGSYPAFAQKIVTKWLESPTMHAAATAHAAAIASSNLSESEEQLEDFCTWLFHCHAY